MLDRRRTVCATFGGHRQRSQLLGRGIGREARAAGVRGGDLKIIAQFGPGVFIQMTVVDSSHRPGQLSNRRLGKHEEPVALIGLGHISSGCSRHSLIWPQGYEAEEQRLFYNAKKQKTQEQSFRGSDRPTEQSDMQMLTKI